MSVNNVEDAIEKLRARALTAEQERDSQRRANVEALQLIAAYISERDAAIHRAESAERERDAAVAECTRMSLLVGLERGKRLKADSRRKHARGCPASGEDAEHCGGPCECGYRTTPDKFSSPLQFSAPPDDEPDEEG